LNRRDKSSRVLWKEKVSPELLALLLKKPALELSDGL
jgi:hypothetical protein